MAMDTYKCPDYQCMEIYTVKSGDTLYAISQAYGIPVSHLMQVNRIMNPYNLKIGQKICIPGNGGNNNGSQRPDRPPQRPCNKTHTIVKGDTLYMIAKQYGVTLDALMKANPRMDPYNLRVGETICIPAKDNDNNSGNNNGNNNSGNNRPPMPSCYGGKAYATQRGDTLARIMDRFGLTYGQLLAANPDVDFEESLEGLTLCIPIDNAGSICDDTYTVTKGDTLDSISERFLLVADRLLIANPELTIVDFSTPGTVICIPQ